MKTSVQQHKIRQKNETKTILVWNAAERAEVRSFGKGKDVFANQNCSYTRCEIVDNRMERPLEHYDAIVVVFNSEFTSANQVKMPGFQYERKKSQRLVFFTQEPPTALLPHYNMTQLANFFNWTMTYRSDADIRLLYGRIIPKENAPRTLEEVKQLREKDRDSVVKPSHNKTKTIAWMVTHCDTHGQREAFIEELVKYIEVDVYGPCGTLSCPRHSIYISVPSCYDLLESTYKFYLSFEKTICPDYVTENFFKTLGRNIVPIVYGGADYTQHAPPHSYIDARKFKPKELAGFLKILDENDDLYNEYFWWKDYYSVESTLDERSRHAFCDLCQKLHEAEDGDYQSYPDLDSQWGNGNQCQAFYPNWL